MTADAAQNFNTTTGRNCDLFCLHTIVTMWLRSSASLLLAACSLPYVVADSYLSSTSLATCQEDSLITASLFDVTFFPGNDTIYYDINANASVTGNVSLTLQVIAYGYYLQPIDINPCDGSSLSTNFCPIETAGEPIDLQASSPVPADIVSRIPGTKQSRILHFRCY